LADLALQLGDAPGVVQRRQIGYAPTDLGKADFPLARHSPRHRSSNFGLR